jgi:hypothetical protein
MRLKRKVEDEGGTGMSGSTATAAITLAAATLLAGLSSVLADAPPAKVAEQAHTEEPQSGPSTTKAKACPAWWITRYDSKGPKTQKGKTGPTPEHKNKSNAYKPPKSGPK